MYDSTMGRMEPHIANHNFKVSFHPDLEIGPTLPGTVGLDPPRILSNRTNEEKWPKNPSSPDGYGIQRPLTRVPDWYPKNPGAFPDPNKMSYRFRNVKKPDPRKENTSQMFVIIPSQPSPPPSTLTSPPPVPSSISCSPPPPRSQPPPSSTSPSPLSLNIAGHYANADAKPVDCPRSGRRYSSTTENSAEATTKTAAESTTEQPAETETAKAEDAEITDATTTAETAETTETVETAETSEATETSETAETSETVETSETAETTDAQEGDPEAATKEEPKKPEPEQVTLKTSPSGSPLDSEKEPEDESEDDSDGETYQPNKKRRKLGYNSIVDEEDSEESDDMMPGSFSSDKTLSEESDSDYSLSDEEEKITPAKTSIINKTSPQDRFVGENGAGDEAGDEPRSYPDGDTDKPMNEDGKKVPVTKTSITHKALGDINLRTQIEVIQGKWYNESNDLIHVTGRDAAFYDRNNNDKFQCCTKYHDDDGILIDGLKFWLSRYESTPDMLVWRKSIGTPDSARWHRQGKAPVSNFRVETAVAELAIFTPEPKWDKPSWVH